jgi:hypothetical protein
MIEQINFKTGSLRWQRLTASLVKIECNGCFQAGRSIALIEVSFKRGHLQFDPLQTVDLA